MKTQWFVTGAIALAASMMVLATAHAQGGPGDGYGPPPGGPGGPGGPGPFGPRPDQLDADKDGTVTVQEYNDAWDKVIWEQFKQLDTNSDKELSKEEMEKLHGPKRGPHGSGDAMGTPPPPPPDGQAGDRRPPMRPPRPTAEELDPNKDGTVTREEYTQAWIKSVEAQFKQLDANKDNVLSREELEKMMGPKRGPGGGFGPGDGPPQR